MKNFRAGDDEPDFKFFVRKNSHKRHGARNFLDAFHFDFVDDQRDNSHARDGFIFADGNFILNGGDTNFFDGVNRVELFGVDVKHSVGRRLEFDFALLDGARR